MNIDNIDIVTANGVALTLSFNDPTAQNPYQMKNLYGLDADEIVAEFAGYSPEDTTNHNLSLKKREIVMRIQLNPNFAFQTYAELRDNLYRVISSGRSGLLTLNFKLATTTLASIQGFVTKVETPISTEVPEMQITVNCPDPRLVAPLPTVLDPSSFGGAFSVSDAVSTAPHGLRMGITWTAVSGHQPAVRISDTENNPTWSFTLRLGDLLDTGVYDFVIGDELEINTNYGERGVWMTRGGIRYPIADRVDRNSAWPMIYPGDNDFYIAAGGGETQGIWTWDYFEYDHTFWGI